MQNNNTVPHFKYHSASIANRQAASIEVEGKAIHKIENPDKFYKEFGYTQDMARAGILPDEFIWSEYTNNSSADFTACIQIHIIEYLIKHSETFRKTYGEKCEGWLAAHEAEAAAKGIACVACRT